MSNRLNYSILELASVGKGISTGETFSNCLDLAQHAEDLGYTRFWLAEHHNMVSIASMATSVLIGYIAGNTKSIRVGSGGIMLPNHSPLIVAEQFGTLEAIYPRRIDLGLGRAPGTDQVTAMAIRSDRMQAVYSFPDDVSQIQQYLSLDNRRAEVRVPLAEGLDLPIYILGSSTESAYVAAKKGLPYAFASHFAPAMLLEALSIYYNHFTPSEQLRKPYTIAGINVIVADTNQDAERISTSMLRMILGVLTKQRDYMQEPTEMNEELRELSRNPAFERMLKYAFVGNKDTVKEKTEAFLKETGVNEVIVASHIYHHQDRLKSYKLFAELAKEINS